MSTEIKQINLKYYGKCVSINNGTVKVIVSVDVGPKIIFWGYTNGENMLYIPYDILEYDEPISQKIPPDIFFKRYGHEIMLAYEKSKPVFLSSGTTIYSILQEGVAFSCSSPKLGLSANLEIIIQDNSNSIMIVHSIENTNEKTQNFSICSSTFVTQDGTLLVPQNIEDLGNAPNRVLSLWKKSNINDSRLCVANEYLKFNNISTDKLSVLKLGINNRRAWSTYTKDGNTFLMHYLHNKKAKYLNFDSSFIIDSKKELLSLKILSPIYNVQKNEVAKMAEYWSLFPTKVSFNDHNEIKKFIDDIN